MKPKYRRAVFIVVYAGNKEKREYLILKRKLHWTGWEFPKGGIGKGEDILNAVKRETFEETGLKVLKIKKFNFSGKFKYSKKFKDRPGFIGQDFSLYATKVNKEKIKIDGREHSDYKWAKFKEAMKTLTFANQRKCLEIVHGYLENEI